MKPHKANQQTVPQTLMLIGSRWARFLVRACSICAALTCFGESRWVSATRIKWTPGASDPNDRAASAPKSQKYWDEHGIPRPDYAKTDAEVLAERGGGGWAFLPGLVILVALLAFAYYFYWIRPGQASGYTMTSTTGHRLGSAGGTSSSPWSLITEGWASLWKSGQVPAAASPPEAPIATSSSSSTPRMLSAEEKARQARLARFDPAALSKEE